MEDILEYQRKMSIEKAKVKEPKKEQTEQVIEQIEKEKPRKDRS